VGDVMSGAGFNIFGQGLGSGPNCKSQFFESSLWWKLG